LARREPSEARSAAEGVGWLSRKRQVLSVEKDLAFVILLDYLYLLTSKASMDFDLMFSVFFEKLGGLAVRWRYNRTSKRKTQQACNDLDTLFIHWRLSFA
jgi:hypothetical protein